MEAEERRAAILDATFPLLAVHGAAVSTRQIAEAAGVAEGTLFRVFEDKHAIVLGAIARMLDPTTLVAELGDQDTGQGLRAVLRDVVTVMQRRGEGVQGVLAVAHDLLRQGGYAADRRRSAAGHGLGPTVDHGPEPTGHEQEPGAAPDDGAAPGSSAYYARMLREGKTRIAEELTAALAGVLRPYAADLRRDPTFCARVLQSLVTSTLQQALTAELTPDQVVEVFLDGMLARTPQETTC